MAEQAAKDEAAKQRIISHMNADHHDSIVRFLEYYHGLPSYTAHGGKMTDVSLSSFNFSCGGKTYEILCKPPMTSYRDARERAVEMDKEAVRGLDRSDITIREYAVPHGPYMGIVVVVAATLIAFSQRSNFAPGSILGSISPEGFRLFCWHIQPYIFYGMLLIHGAETVNMARGRLRRHNVNIATPLYWKWLADTFLEGVGAYNRFDNMVEQKRAEKQRQKH